MKTFSCLLVLFCAMTLVADTYFWRVTQPGTFAWESTNAWDVVGDPANSNLWPRNPGDVANLFVQESQTQIYGVFQAWFTENKFIGDMACSLSNRSGNNQILFTAENSPLVFFDNPAKGFSQIVHTNVTPLDATAAPNNQQLFFLDNTVFVLSNDLYLANYCVDNPSNLVDYTDMLFAENTQIIGNGHKIVKNGPGWLYLGYYDGDVVSFLGASMLEINGCVLELDNSVFVQSVVDCPVRANSITDCRNEYQRAEVDLVGKTFTMPLIVANGAFLSTPYSGDGVTSWLQRSLTGGVSIIQYGFLWPYWLADGRVWTNDIAGPFTGDGSLYTGFSNVKAGSVRFLDSIAPGTNSMGVLYIRTFTNQSVHIGTKTDKVDINIDVDGLRNWIGQDADFLGYVQGSNPQAAGLGNMDLILNVGSQSNPYRTNEIMWSRESQFAGEFNSISWLGGRTGEVIVTPESVYVTGITPATTNFFDLTPDSILLEQGQTQAWVTLRSPYSVNVTASNDEPWITVAPQVAVPANTPVQTSVNVPAGQPTTNGWGFSVGSVWYRAAADPTTAYEVPVFVVQPGYFALNEDQLYFYADAADYQTVRAYAPFGVNASVTPINSAWITPDPTSIGMTDSYAYVDINVAAMPAGTTGTVRFANTGVPSVVHDLPVYVVANGFFDTVEKQLTFVQGETQKWFEIFSPFRAEVDMQGSAPWVTVPPHISLDGDAWLVPVEIPASQPVDSTGQVALVNSCFSNITQTVTITVVPEAGMTALLAVIALGWLRRARA